MFRVALVVLARGANNDSKRYSINVIIDKKSRINCNAGKGAICQKDIQIAAHDCYPF